MEQIAIYLDGIKLNSLPPDIVDFEEELVRDTELFGLVTKYPLDLTFVGDGYKYLLGLKKNEGYCRRVEVLITFAPNGDPTYGTTIRGFLFISDMEHDHTKKTIKCSIEDNNFGSILKQNAKVPVDVRSIVSRNDVSISATSSFALVVYNPSTGVNYVDACTAYNVNDVFNHMIEFLTDNEMTFQSDFLTNLPDDEKICLVRGQELRDKNNTVPQVMVSFQQLMEFLHKKYNLWFCVDNSGQTPIFRLEEEDFFYSTSTVKINQVKNLSETFDQEKLTSVIKVGCSDNIKETGVAHSLPFVSAITFVEEDYFLKGTCGIDAELDLVSEEIQADTNIIQDLVTGTSGEYDDDVFCIQFVESTFVAHKGEYILSTPGGTPKLYNEQMLNLNVLNRFKAPTDVSQITGNGTNDNFRASRSTNVAMATTNPLDFDDETTPPNIDPGGNYSIVTYRYTAPANGLYSFETGLNYEITQLEYSAGNEWMQNFIPAILDVDVFMVKKNAAATQLQLKQVNSIVHSSTGEFQKTGNATFYMNAGDTIEAYMTVAYDSFIINFAGTLLGGTDSYFKTTYVFTGGGEISVGDSQNIAIINLDFKTGISNKDWRLMVSQSYNGVTINTNGVNDTLCWVNSVKRKLFKGTCDFKLVTTLAEMKLWEI